MERRRHLALSPEIRTRVLKVSAGTMHRLLRPTREASRPGCRQRQRFYQRDAREFLLRSPDRADAISRLQEERSGLDRTEERFGHSANGRIRAPGGAQLSSDAR